MPAYALPLMKAKPNSPEKLLLLVAGILSLATLPLAHAVPTLRLTDGVTTVTIPDMSSDDVNPTEGAVTFVGSVGSFSVTSVRTFKTTSRKLDAAFLFLNSVDVFSPPLAGPLTISLSEDSFGPAAVVAIAHIDGFTSGTVLFSTYADTSNALFGTSTLLTQPQSFSGPGFSTRPFDMTSPVDGKIAANLRLLSPFSLTQEVVIDHGASPNGLLVTSFNAHITTLPDRGSTIALLGAVLVGFFGWESLRRKFRGAVMIT